MERSNCELSKDVEFGVNGVKLARGVAYRSYLTDARDTSMTYTLITPYPFCAEQERIPGCFC